MLLSGADRPAHEILREQLTNQLPDNLLIETEGILENLERSHTVNHVSQELQIIFRPSIQPYLISWMQYNPVQELVKLDSKVLIINGTKDGQVLVSDAEKLHNARKDSKLIIVENMNHILKEAPAYKEGD